MKNIDYIIVGDGYAALFFAHQLLKNNKTFVLFSESKKSASQISAGIINPVVLKRFAPFWLAQEQINYLKEILLEIETYTGKNYLIDKPIHRIFHDETEKELWLKKAQRPDLLPFLNPNFRKLKSIKNPLDCGVVDHSSRLNVTDFFRDILCFLKENNHLIQEKFNYQNLNPNNFTYQNFQFKNIIFAEGIAVQQNPYFAQIPVLHNKGHHLKVKLSRNIDGNFTIKKKHFLFPLENEFYYYGGTYDREQIHQIIDNDAKEQLINGLSEFYENNFDVVEVSLGFRPTVKDRRPILGQHPEHPNLFVFNGLGARGILNGSYFSKNLFEFIEHQKPLQSEIDLKRFLE